MSLLRSGDVVHVGAAASVQFKLRPLLFRVIRVLDWPTYDGWAWLDGYQLDRQGEAVERRTIFVQPAGLRPARLNTAARRIPRQQRRQHHSRAA